jgi:hypothetical protein
VLGDTLLGALTDMPRVAYIVFSHRLPDQVARLVRVLQSESDESLVAVHHDPRSEPLARDVLGLPRVWSAPQPRPFDWGSWDEIEAWVGLLRWLLDSARFDWAVFLSGQDYPVAPLSRIERELGSSSHHAHIDAAPIYDVWDKHEARLRYFSRTVPIPGSWYSAVPRRIGRAAASVAYRASRRTTLVWLRWVAPAKRGLVGFRTRRPIPDERFYGGAAWCSLSRAAAAHLVAATAGRSALAEHFSHTLIPAEAYFHTVLCNAHDLRIDTDARRYVSFEPGSERPRTMTGADVRDAAAAGAHFARKFDSATDPDALDLADAIRQRS